MDGQSEPSAEALSCEKNDKQLLNKEEVESIREQMKVIRTWGYKRLTPAKIQAKSLENPKKKTAKSRSKVELDLGSLSEIIENDDVEQPKSPLTER